MSWYPVASEILRRLERSTATTRSGQVSAILTVLSRVPPPVEWPEVAPVDRDAVEAGLGRLLEQARRGGVAYWRLYARVDDLEGRHARLDVPVAQVPDLAELVVPRWGGCRGPAPRDRGTGAPIPTAASPQPVGDDDGRWASVERAIAEGRVTRVETSRAPDVGYPVRPTREAGW